MSAPLVTSAAGVILAALKQNRTAAGIALALDSARLLMTPETTAELKRLQERVAELEEKSSRTAADATPCEDYPGELAMLRGLVRTLRVTARYGEDMGEVRQLLVEHASDDEAARQAVSS